MDGFPPPKSDTLWLWQAYRVAWYGVMGLYDYRYGTGSQRSTFMTCIIYIYVIHSDAPFIEAR